MSAALATAMMWHAAIVALVVLLSHHVRDRSDVDPYRDPAPPMIWVARGGGGGGGNEQSSPPSALQRAGEDRRSMPTSHPAPTSAASVDVPEPRIVDTVVIPVVALGSSAIDLPGLIDQPASSIGPSQGRGSRGGAGNGDGSGSGDGLGPGRGPGRGGWFGDGVYPPGGDVTRPVPVHIERPRYSTDAVRARVQGVVLVECVVRPDGACSDIRVVRSLDPQFGLDDAAVQAAAQWRFQPGTRFGRPVPVRVRIELEFSVR